MIDVIQAVELPRGVRLPYVEQGDPSGVPVVLLHGITDSWHSFEGVLPHLPRSIHAFALTQRGHGDASRPATGYRPQDFAADVAAFLDALDLERAVIAGHSMGGYVAQAFALDYPERTQGLVLAATCADLQGNPVVTEFWNSAVSQLTDPIDPQFVREFQESTIARPVPQAFFETAVQESLKVPARVWRAAFEGLLETDLSAEISRVKSPTLILWGDRDAYFPLSGQETIAEAIRGAQLVIYRGAGHALHWEEPARFAADLADFAEKLAG